LTKRSHPLDRFARDLPAGRLEWIGLRPARREALQAVDEAQVIAGRGLAGDHRSEKTPGSGRQVTVISREFIGQIAHFLGRGEAIDPALLRRNLVVSGINLHALRHQRFTIGESVLLEAGALCHPCSRMETNLGRGGVAAMFGHGGLCCRVLESGAIRVGDPVAVSLAGLTDDLFMES
jgi:MOSC domain-containing protein YiiM